MKYVKGFFKFWYDFLIGDTPEITLAIVVILAVVALLGKGNRYQAPILVVGVIATFSMAFFVEVAKKARKAKAGK
ncbi:MAG: hypothetical protein M0Z45_04710 [Actinomycetota bacterium]|nr:hypothetical protein [Actinomycetota bacterium]